jgi:hypothetical protein
MRQAIEKMKRASASVVDGEVHKNRERKNGS